MSSEPSNVTVLRPVGLIERWHTARGYLGFDTCVIVAAKHQSDVPLTREFLVSALAQIIPQTCPLAVQVHGEAEGQPVFVRLKSVDISRVLTVFSGENISLVEIMDTCFMQPFEKATEDPLWRVALLPDNTVVFQFDHAIADGQSGVAFHILLSEALNNLQQEGPAPSSAEVVSIPDDLTMLPPIEGATDVSPSFGRFCGVIFGLLAPASWSKGFTAWSGNNVRDKQLIKNNTRLWHIPPEQVSSIMDACRAHKSTLTSFFHAVATSVLTELILSSAPQEKNNGKPKLKFIATSIPVSFRQHTKLGPDVLCNYVSSIVSFPSLPKSSPKDGQPVSWETYFSWEDSTKMAKRLRDNALKCRQQLGMLKYIFGKYHEFIGGKVNKKRDAGLEISNVGRWPGEAGEKHLKAWTVDDVYFAQFDTTVGGAIKVSVAGRPSGSVGVVFNWGEGAVEDAFADSFVQKFEGAVQAILEKGK